MTNTPDQTLLHHLLCNGYAPEDYLDALDGIADVEIKLLRDWVNENTGSSE